ncbi:hypothetical protein EHQ68_01345 [Leptospira congkakensis]|uniref:Uncharacterized protein n=1 Tax=Leptospira congkakensis TaxID=2484932 RepID=A0A8B5NHW6_9LEPT|nr:hypothetical protein [Leptospira congkakensis]TGL91112.1 hypothetical protein EHQ68_01345 [Leptospira congkakensis]TGL97049.1 hypothetical protein EHQ69_00130 [Leptospira congkakensis]
MEFSSELAKYAAVIFLGNISMICMNICFNRKKSLLIYQCEKRLTTANNLFRSSWLTGTIAYIIFFLFLISDFATNIIKSISSFYDIAVPKKPKYYTNLSDFLVLLLVSTTFYITSMFPVDKIKLGLFIYIIWRVFFHIITNLQLTFESFLSSSNSPDTLHSQARSLILWVLAILEISIIYSWNKNESFSGNNLISYIYFDNDYCGVTKIPLYWFQLLAFIQIIGFFANLRNIPQNSDL